MPGPAEIGTAKVEWGGATHIGAGHERNQDASCAQPPVFVVADGVGGHTDGELASAEVIQALLALSGQVSVDNRMLTAALQDARERIGRIPSSGGRPPGSTLSGMIVTHVDGRPSWMIVNIGDSRTYRLDSSGLNQVTVDHSVVQQLIDSGAVGQSARRDLPFRNLLTRALFADADHQHDVSVLPLTAGDRMLACSDGVHGAFDPSVIEQVLRAHRDPQTAADELVAMAVRADGHDDMTAVVVDAVGHQ